MKKQILMSLILMIFLAGFVTALSIESVSTEPSEIAPGQEAKIDIDIWNNLKETAEEVVVSLDLKELPFAPYQSSTEKTVDKIKEDRTERVSFDIIALAEAKAGTYKIPVEISYKIDVDDEVEEKQKTSYISLMINANPNLDLHYEGDIVKGEKNKLIIKIINSGLSDVKLLGVEISNVGSMQVLDSKSVYIGNIDSDDFDTAEFSVFVKESSGSTISLPVKISYKDALNNDYEEDRTLSVRVYSTEEAISLGLIKKNNTGLVVGGVLAIIVLYFLYRYIKKRKRKKENNL